jgi:hypothetical protein
LADTPVDDPDAFQQHHVRPPAPRIPVFRA